jgi:protein-L-isoaspartate(D-aspartate) O-methyltransferase
LCFWRAASRRVCSDKTACCSIFCMRKHLSLYIQITVAVFFLLAAVPASLAGSDLQEKYGSERESMVRSQIESRGIRDPGVLAAMRSVPRHLFIPEAHVNKAYGDYPVPIGLGQTISQPYIVALMTELLHLDSTDRVFELGTGSGYQAAVASRIAGEVCTAEIYGELAGAAAERLRDLGYANVQVMSGDGYFGWEEKSPFDAIIVTAAADHIPPPLIKQLKPGGRLVIPLGNPFFVQQLVLVTKDSRGGIKEEPVTPVRFVPLLGH